MNFENRCHVCTIKLEPEQTQITLACTLDKTNNHETFVRVSCLFNMSKPNLSLTSRPEFRSAIVG